MFAKKPLPKCLAGAGALVLAATLGSLAWAADQAPAPSLSAEDADFPTSVTGPSPQLEVPATPEPVFAPTAAASGSAEESESSAAKDGPAPEGPEPSPEPAEPVPAPSDGQGEATDAAAAQDGSSASAHPRSESAPSQPQASSPSAADGRSAADDRRAAPEAKSADPQETAREQPTEAPASPPAADRPAEQTASAPLSEEPADDAPEKTEDDEPLAPGTLLIGGASIPYRDVRGGTTPKTGAGLWLGDDSTADGSWGYFVGHNPGSFAPVRSLDTGDAVTLCDRAGKSRAYTVRTVFSVAASATWKTIAPRVTGYGESLILQTCAGDGETNVIVVAA